MLLLIVLCVPSVRRSASYVKQRIMVVLYLYVYTPMECTQYFLQTIYNM